MRKPRPNTYNPAQVLHLINSDRSGVPLSCPSCRARPDATVSTPLEWDELTDDLDPGEFTIETAPQRFAELGDIWAKQLKKKNSLRALV